MDYCSNIKYRKDTNNTILYILIIAIVIIIALILYRYYSENYRNLDYAYINNYYRRYPYNNFYNRHLNDYTYYGYPYYDGTYNGYYVDNDNNFVKYYNSYYEDGKSRNSNSSFKSNKYIKRKHD